MGFIVFSYKQTAGKGGNRMVGLVKSELERRYGHTCEQKHSMNVGKGHDLFNGSRDNPDWFVFWKTCAGFADLVVMFDSDDNGYYGSDACMKEKNWVQNHKTGGYLSCGRLIDQNETAEEIAAYIDQRL